VRRVEIRKEKADGDRLHAFFLELAHGLADLGLVERVQHLALGRHQPLRHRLAVAALDQRPILPGDVLHDRVMLRPLVAADVKDVAVAAGGDQAGDGALMLEHGVGGDGGAVEHRVDGVARDLVLVAQRHQAGDDAARGIVGRGRDLVHRRLARLGVGIDQVGKGPADIDADQPHSRLPCQLCQRSFVSKVCKSRANGSTILAAL
jgi:hypothetical protein